MRGYLILAIAGGILAISGIYLLIPAAPVSGDRALSIPAGDYFTRLTFHVFKSDRISGNFYESSGNTITLYIFNGEQLGIYKSTGRVNGMFQVTSARGTYSASFSSPGDYYLVVAHDVSDSGLIQSVNVSFTLDGTNSLVLGSGIFLIAAGAGMIILGNARKRRTETPRSISDVVLFDQPNL
ncbi:hypothetical protein J2P12_03705 [Candidatus Bathyarchaeota archaeon]|nr:hypothetical protein [Candidatus Bathyarchaeota archaeon]